MTATGSVLAIVRWKTGDGTSSEPYAVAAASGDERYWLKGELAKLIQHSSHFGAMVVWDRALNIAEYMIRSFNSGVSLDLDHRDGYTYAICWVEPHEADAFRRRIARIQSNPPAPACTRTPRTWVPVKRPGA